MSLPDHSIVPFLTWFDSWSKPGKVAATLSVNLSGWSCLTFSISFPLNFAAPLVIPVCCELRSLICKIKFALSGKAATIRHLISSPSGILFFKRFCYCSSSISVLVLQAVLFSKCFGRGCFRRGALCGGILGRGESGGIASGEGVSGGVLGACCLGRGVRCFLGAWCVIPKTYLGVAKSESNSKTLWWFDFGLVSLFSKRWCFSSGTVL